MLAIVLCTGFFFFFFSSKIFIFPEDFIIVKSLISHVDEIVMKLLLEEHGE